MSTGWIVAALLLVMPAGAFAAGGEACTLLTDAQVTAALGVTVSPGTPIGLPTSCQWVGKGKIATLTLERFDTGKKSNLPGIKVEPVSGVGDDAYYVFYSGTNRALGLVVKKGKNAFEVRVYGFDLEQAKPVARTLAQNVAGKL